MHARDTGEDRRTVNGEPGRGDMLGGLSTGAGSQLGLPDDETADDDRVQTIPAVPTEKDGDESETDEAGPDHGASDPA